MNNQESDKSILDKTYPMDLASKPPPTKPMETSGIVKPPQASPLTLRHSVQPNLRVVTTVPALTQHITAGPHLISHIVPQVGIKQVDANSRTHITAIPARSTSIQAGQTATRTILSTLPLSRGGTTISNVTGPRIRPPAAQSQCQQAAHVSVSPANIIPGVGAALPVGHVNSNSVGPIGVTVNVPVGFVRAAVPPRASSPAAGTAWIGGTVQVQTVQVCSANVTQRIPTFTTVGRANQSNAQNPRQTLIQQTTQVSAMKSTSSTGALSVQTIASNSTLPVRSQQNQSATLVYGSSVSHGSRLHALPTSNAGVAQRVKGVSGNNRQIQVNATPRPHITVSGTLSARICPNPSTNVTGVACNNSVNNPHIVSYTNSIPQTQNLTTSTAGGMNRVAVNNISISRTIQGQNISSGNKLVAHVSSSAQNMQSQTTAASMPITSTTNIISSTNMNTNNLSSNSSNISGLVQLHPTAVFVASSGGRNSNTKLLAQITPPAGIKTNGSNVLQTSIQAISINSTSCTTLGANTNISTTAITNSRSGCTVPTRIIASVPKTFSQTSETSANIYVHRSSPGALGITESKTAGNNFPASGGPYYYNASYNTATNLSTNTTVPQSSHSVHSVSQSVCFNPIMIVESSTGSIVNSTDQTNHTASASNQLTITTNVQQNVLGPGSTTQGIPSSQTSGNLLAVVHHGQIAPVTSGSHHKSSSSPRPSILRKRDHDGINLKAAKNLTPSLHVITNNPPISPQQRPDSRGNCPSSAGSTTISATSSPGLEDQEEDHKYPLNLEVNSKYVPDRSQDHVTDDTKYSGLNVENLRKFNLETKDQVYTIEERMKLNTPVERLHTGIRTNRDYNVLENRYKYENRIQTSSDNDQKINISLIEGDAFKTANDVNIKHEDINSRRNLRQDDDRPTEMSPRKKPRKQQLTANESVEGKTKSEDLLFISETRTKSEMSNTPEVSERLKDVTVRKPPSASLLSYYKQSWKSTQYHFQRYSDVKPKDERKPNIIDLANQSHVLQKINGWKIYHLSTQMEDMSEMESQVYDKLSGLLMLMEKEENTKEMININELIKGNMQRSKIINDGMVDAKNQIMRIFDHKANVSDIIHRCASKRNFKKRDKS